MGLNKTIKNNEYCMIFDRLWAENEGLIPMSERIMRTYTKITLYILSLIFPTTTEYQRR